MRKFSQVHKNCAMVVFSEMVREMFSCWLLGTCYFCCDIMMMLQVKNMSGWLKRSDTFLTLHDFLLSYYYIIVLFFTVFFLLSLF